MRNNKNTDFSSHLKPRADPFQGRTRPGTVVSARCHNSYLHFLREPLRVFQRSWARFAPDNKKNTILGL
jgi:hypothetical protein